MSVPVHLRPARSTDAGHVGEILWRANPGSALRPDLFSCAEAIGLCGDMIDRGWVTVAEDATGCVIGFLAREDDTIQALYVAHAVAGQGVGKQLLDEAKTRVGQLHLRAYQADKAVGRFYRREGFVEQGRGDANDLRAPDIHFLWQKADET